MASKITHREACFPLCFVRQNHQTYDGIIGSIIGLTEKDRTENNSPVANLHGLPAPGSLLRLDQRRHVDDDAGGGDPLDAWVQQHVPGPQVEEDPVGAHQLEGRVQHPAEVGVGEGEHAYGEVVADELPGGLLPLHAQRLRRGELGVDPVGSKTCLNESECGSQLK